MSKVVLVLFLRATRLCGRTFALQLSFFLSTVSRTLNYTAWIRLDIYLPCAKKRFWRIIIVDFGFGERALGERERFFFCVSLCCSATKHCLKKEPPARDLSLSHLHLHLFIYFFQKLREREDTHKKTPPSDSSSLHFFVCNRRDHRQSSIIVMGARSEIAMGGADVMTFVRSTRPGFPEGLKVRLLFFFFSLSLIFLNDDDDLFSNFSRWF